MASPSLAGEFCSDAPYFGVIDGDVLSTPPIQITIDTDCTFQNWPQSNPLTTTVNFQTNDPTIYLIIFDNVTFIGNMACSSIDHRIWFSNGADYGSGNACQDLFIPVETIAKQNPVGQTSVGIGEPFTYTLTLPSMQLSGDPSLNDLHTVILWDDLTATGADLTSVSLNAYYKGSGAPVTLVPEDDPSAPGGVWTPKNLSYKPIPLILSGEQIVVEITVVPDDTPANAAGTQFTNTAKWWFGRLIDGQFYEPLPGEWGRTQPMTIAEPELVVTKSSDETALNLGVPATFTIDVQNRGGSDAWNATIIDVLPDSADAGMCEHDPTASLIAQLFQADGTLASALTPGTDYSITYTGCQLGLTMLTDRARIAPDQHLIVTYQSELDAGTTGDGLALTNVAGATEWFSSSNHSGRKYTGTLSDGTPSISDHQDSQTVTTALSGYYFQKTVENLTSHESPAAKAAPGDRLRYRLRLFNVDQTIDNISIDDPLDPNSFDLTTFQMVTLPAGAAYNFDATGLLEISGDTAPLNVAVGDELVIEFDIDLATNLTNGSVVANQASLSAASLTALSDDPYLNGIASPGDPADVTSVVIQTPGPPSKTNTRTSATIGEQFTYTIAVPAAPVDVPLYDIRILDDLLASNADMRFVGASVVSGGTWTLSNTSGSDTALVIEDMVTGIDIPANGQAVIEITVELLNTATNTGGLPFNNGASYTYNRSNGESSTQTVGGADSSGDMTVVEPHIAAITKSADKTTATAGEIVRYSVTLTASGGPNYSDVFDITIIDTLDPGLVYEGNPTVSVGTGASADNTIGAPDISGDGSSGAPQTLVWGLGGIAPADIDIAEGASVTVSYDVRVLDGVLANQALTNSALAQWTGIDGTNSSERNGTDGIGGLNDYLTPAAAATLTTPDINATLAKNRTGDTYGSGDADVRIGDIVEYELRLSVPEGTLGTLELVDTLPQGMDFEGIVSINGNPGPVPYSAVAPFAHADITAADVTETGDAALGSTTVTWSLGSVTNQPDDGLSDDFVIVYRARVLNDVFAPAALSIPLNNVVEMSYDTATGRLTRSDNATLITALQPMLSVTKSSSPVSGSSIAAGDTVTYTVDIQNTGQAPAYDVVLKDLIPFGMRVGMVTMTSTHLLSTPMPGLANPAPAYDPTTGVADWDLDSGVYMIPAGDTLRVVYSVLADADLGPGLTLTNEAQVTAYYSFDDEAVPTLGTVTGVRERYGPTAPASTTLYSGAPPIMTVGSPAEATIGEEVAYRIAVPGTVSTSALHDVQITDTLNQNLEFVSATVTGGIGVADNSTTTPSEMKVAITEIPAGQQVVIELRARVRNTLPAQQGVDIANTVSYTYANVAGGATQPALISAESVTVKIVEPHIAAITKSSDKTAPTAGEIVRYFVTLTASGGADSSDVFDVMIVDTLGAGLVYEGNAAVTVGTGASADNSIGAPDITGDGSSGAPQTLIWGLGSTIPADIDIAEGASVTVSYDVRVLDSVLANQVLTNSAVAQWTGIDGTNSSERNGTDGIGGLNDYVTPTAVAPVTTPGIIATIVKNRTGDTYGEGDADVRIGDIVEYELRLSVPEGTLGALELVDTLPQGLDFEGIVSINGNPGPAPYSAVAPFAHADITAADVTEAGDPALGSTTVTWRLGSVTNQPDDGLSDDFVIVYRGRVLNNVFAPTALSIPLNNVVTLSYDTATGRVTQSDNATLITALQPMLTVSKSAAPAGGDTVIDAGESITYTIDLSNRGAAPAYDVAVQDILPPGLRQGGVTPTGITLVTAGTSLPVLAPAYDPATGTATWNFDTGTADLYTIPAGETLRLVYRVLADADLAPGLNLTNTAQAKAYYSFDDEAMPGGSTVDQREEYGPSPADSTTLTTPQPVALLKETTQASASIGEEFSYRITLPSAPQTTALNDVRLIDDLTASAADLSFVSVAKISGSQPWTPVNTGDAKNLVIEDTTTGIDIPAGEQAVIEITVALDDSANNLSGLAFSNSADYTHNQVNGDPATQASGLPGTSGDMTIAGPDTLTLEKSGPLTMRVGLPETFTINMQNTGTAPAWDLTITDQLPNPSPGGMCDAAPVNITAQIFQADGVTPVSPLLVQGTDYAVGYSGEPDCSLTLTMQSAAAAIGEGERLILTYEASLDTDSVGGTILTNLAAATEWFSGDTAGSGATGSIRTYTGTLSDGTTGTPDEQDAHSLTTESPVLLIQQSVVNVTSGQDPGASARPGDTLRYTIHVENLSDVDLPDFSVADELDALHATSLFAPGSLTILSVPAGADTSNTDANGGASGTGLLDVRNLSLDAQGGANAAVDLLFEATLAPVITSGTAVLNQARLSWYGVPLGDSDDPNLNGPDDPQISGDEDPTQTLITSAPFFEVWKTSSVISGDPNLLMAGETLRYTLTVRNVGTEDAVDARLRDYVPANTSYVPNSTMLNGTAVPDPGPAVSPLQAGLLIHAPQDAATGYLPAGAFSDGSNTATVTFDVRVDPTVVDGLIVENQGFLSAAGLGSGTQPEQPSDDPSTPILLDPTRNIVGNLPLLYALKTVQLQQDFGSPEIVDPGDVLRYAIEVRNDGAIQAGGVVLTDQIPADTTYLADSLQMNGALVGVDNGVSPLGTGLTIQSSDQPGAGLVSPGESALVSFDVRVNDGVAAGTLISNQGRVSSLELPMELTDADGLPANGHQPTVVVVGDVQFLSITKEVLVVGGGSAEAGGQLEYVIRVRNIGSLPATHVRVTDDLAGLAGQATYVSGSGTLNGLAAGVAYAGTLLSADYAATYGELLPGAGADLRFRVRIDPMLAIGTTLSNTGTVSWSDPARTESASAALDLGGTPGSGSLNGRVWHDGDLNRLAGVNENVMAGWSVDLYRGNLLQARVQTDADGRYRFSGLAPNDGYELLFRAPGAGSNTASLGYADSLFTNGPHRIGDITVVPGGNLEDLNLPVTPNGTVYDSVLRVPVAGARLTLLSAATRAPLPSACFDDPQQQQQVSLQDGYYRFDLNFSDAACQPGDSYVIEVAAPATGYLPAPSVTIPPNGGPADHFSVPDCPGSADDALPSTAEFCEVTTSASLPAPSVPPRTGGTSYHLNLILDNGIVPGHSQLFNNHIPLDPELDGAVAISKSASWANVSRGQQVPYTITVSNVMGVPLYDIGIVDRFPAGFKYVPGSARFDGDPLEPQINGQELLWDGFELQVNDKHTIQLLLVVGGGVSEGEFTNRAQVISTSGGGPVSGLATATVRVMPDPDFDCTDVIGKVFDDRNLNGQQEEGEEGLAGVNVVTVRGLIASTDEHGRFHITCATVPDQDRGSNFILKLDDRSLPTGYRVITENPRVQRATRGKMLRFNYGAALHRVVSLQVADGVFEPESVQLRPQWQPRLEKLLEVLGESPSILRLSYLADVESESLVKKRLKAMRKNIFAGWRRRDEAPYRLTVETEVFWRRGSPL